ncbi:MAG: hypothetical protein Q9212_003274 [Teloschistes hypoglaucus]
MPYHLLYRPQQTKDILFRPPHTLLPQIESFRSSSYRHSGKQIVERDPTRPPHLRTSRRVSVPLTPKQTFIWLAFAIILALILGVGCLYAEHLWRKSLSNSYCPSRGRRRHKKKHSIDLSFLTPRINVGIPELAFPTPNFSLSGLSKRRKAPPPSLDLEALKPGKGDKKRSWWGRLPSIISARASAFTPLLVAESTVDLGGKEAYERSSDSDSWIAVESTGNSTSNSHDPNAARARRVSEGNMAAERWHHEASDHSSKITQAVTAGFVDENPVMARFMNEDDEVFPTDANRRVREVLVKHFHEGGVGIQRDVVGN